MVLRLLVAVVLLLSLTAAALPQALPQRVLWTWDNRMDWVNPGRAVSVMGGGRYTKDPGDYVRDYRALIDYLHDHTAFNGIIIWGFLRDTHGGVAAAQEVCDYAAARGVRVIPGVGTSGYEGYYYEGGHRYNISHWLREHPELRARDRQGKPLNALCPSKPENVRWLEEGCRWLLSTFRIGGINFEIGDFFVCYCDGCRAARAAIPGDAPDYYKDMALSTAPVARLAHELAPDAWLSYATYTGFTPQMAAAPPSWVSLVPPQTACQWTLTAMDGEQGWPAGLRPPTPLNTGYLHWGNKSTHSVNGFFVRRTAEVCRRAATAGFAGLTTYGEDPPSIFSMRLFYDAWSHFLTHPQDTVADYERGSLASWFDSPAEAHRLLEIVVPLEASGLTRATATTAARAVEQARAAAPGEKSRAVWTDFAAFLRTELAAIQQADRLVIAPAEVERLLREGFRVPQESATTLVLPRPAGDTLELTVRVQMAAENGLLPVMVVKVNGTVLGPDRVLDRPAAIRTPYHGGYPSLPAFDPAAGAWRVKYAPAFELEPDRGQKYYTPDYRPLFRFRVGDLWREGDNRLEIANRESRFRPSEQGVLVVGKVAVR